MNADKNFRICELPKTTQDRLYKALTLVSKEVSSYLGDYGKDFWGDNMDKFVEKAYEEVNGLNHDHVFNYFDTMLKLHRYTWLEDLTEKNFNTNKKIVFWYFQSKLKGAGDARERMARKEA